ncbi:MAG: hypothetical protein IT463_12250 [Planctomycetes bacterium]|nr:hypothetical protein [Planctomycetota bacterium]
MSELNRYVNYEPHAGQAQFHGSTARFKVLVAGARFGKSLAAAREVLPEVLGGRTRGWFVGPSYALALPEFRFLREALRELGLKPAREHDGGRTGPSYLLMPWGAEALSLSARQPETLLGEELDWLVLCEAAHLGREVFERFLRARLSTRLGRMVLATTPRGHNWVHEAYRRGLVDTRGEWQSFRYATWDNPRISAEEVASARQTLPPETFDEQYGGGFTLPAGRVYPEFSRLRHMADGLLPPPGSVIYRALDFGYTNPFVCLWACEDHEGRLLVLHEHVQRHATLPEHARVIREQDDRFRALGCVIGPAVADPSGALERQTLATEGVRTLPARNALAAGLDLVRARLLPRADGRPGLLVSSLCPVLAAEFEAYAWAETPPGAERVPRKQDDHTLDALRYLCAALKQRAGWQDQAPVW